MKKDNRYFRQGQVLILMVFFLVVGLIVMGLAIDVGLLNMHRQSMKKAADAAALAAVLDIGNTYTADATAKNYAQKNGYTHGTNGITVQSTINPTGINPNWLRVTITAPFQFIFGRIIGLKEKNISVFSTAQYNTTVPISINLAGVYGQDNPDVSLSIRGRNTLYEHGDPKATEDMDNGNPNPYYDPDGYYYGLYVPVDYAVKNGSSLLKVEIWDADSYGDYDSTGTRTNTTYVLYRPDSTPKDHSDDVQIASYTKGGSNVWSTNRKWYQPSGWLIDTATYGTGFYTIQVKVGSGYNANGFSLRAGPNRTPFDPENGTSISADGPLPIRFNKTGSVMIQLGEVPASAAGVKMHINKFDTDIGSSTCTYTCSSSATVWTGLLAGNAEWKEDIIDIPLDYSGGVWYGHYNAGLTDVSYWEMWYEGQSDDLAGFAVLVE